MPKTVKHIDNLPYFGEDQILKIAENRKFSDMIFELLSGNKPTAPESKLFETILNISIDHGDETPSATEVIRLAKEGKTISEAVAGGIMQINDVHGGAIEPAMELFYKIAKEKPDIKSFVNDYLKNGKRMAGFGHRIYEIDPRSQFLFDLVQKQGLSDDFIKIAKEIESELKLAKGKSLPVNIDGSIAAILCTFGWDTKLGKAVFVIARCPGLCGQYLNSII